MKLLVGGLNSTKEKFLKPKYFRKHGGLMQAMTQRCDCLWGRRGHSCIVSVFGRRCQLGKLTWGGHSSCAFGLYHLLGKWVSAVS